MQQAELTVTTIEAAKALRELPILLHFLEPRSPSDVAKDADMPANLVHHHAKRAFELGLLLETKRESGKVYYQLAARTFKHPRDLLDVEAIEHDDLRQLNDAFVKAYLRSDHIAGHLDPDYAVYGFGNPATAPFEGFPQYTSHTSSEARPAHLQTRTVRLSAWSYRQLVQRISDALLEARMESGGDVGTCSFAFLAFDGELREGHSDSQTINSFLALPNH